MAKHANNILNSEANDEYFSYDGDWKDGTFTQRITDVRPVAWRW